MKILICSDGSEQADRAVKLGAAIATGCHAEATLLGINETSGEDTVLLDSLKRGQAVLEAKKTRSQLVLKRGNAVEEIANHTRESHYDLVVIGAVRKGLAGTFWMSSKSYRIIKQVEPPVLSVAGKSSAIRKILICSGGKHYIDNAVRLTGQIAGGMGSSVSLLHVVPEAPAIYSHLPRMVETPAEVLSSKSELGVNLRNSKKILESAGVSADLRVRTGSVLREILAEISSGDYDLIVAGSALSRGFRTYVLGDITRELLNRVSCAVLVVRSTPAESDSHSHLPFPKLFHRSRRSAREDGQAA
ncbi:MAG TPA: universal stress protein [Verrucomicrobiae bacterium]|nr:universal stress protein [Verrucomicrobiae bacterium]